MRVFNRLAKQVEGRKARESRFPTVPVRLRALEESVFEISQLLAKAEEAGLLGGGVAGNPRPLGEAAVSFRAHLEEVLKHHG